ncbi:MAG: 23S rRNA (adenine(2030)-N(6))-methyltransferase RlmJ [Rickettsiaceae bacterium]|nr:23S rRNA (adenine(2030)-N(6))-methyltransferase RlmJ [Rickettsiaceae bacterium]
MNYRHIYHAGNFADVLKHIVLISLINKLKQKEKPFGVLDAFAGTGIYNIAGEKAQKTGEAKTGIELIKSGTNYPDLVAQYLDIVSSFSKDTYPGSPAIIASLLRDNDRLIATELHSEDYAELKKNMRSFKNSEIHHMDAYNATKAFTPLKEKRGLILIDPPFEVKDEFDKIINALTILNPRFISGIVMTWYPMKDKKTIADFYEKYKKIGYKESFILEFEIKLEQKEGAMNKCGIIISNPPDVKKELQCVLDYLTSNIYKGIAKASMVTM